MPENHDQSQRSIHAIILSLALATGIAGPARAQVEFGNPYTVNHDLQATDQEDEKIQAIRVPVNIKLRSWQDGSMGLRLRLATTFAVNDLAVLQQLDFESVRVLTFLPGLEFIFPIAETQMLRPYVDLGVGTNNATDDLSFLADIGLRTEFIFPTGNYIFGLEPGVQINTNSFGRTPDQTTFNPFITLSGRRVMGFRIGGQRPDAEAYAEAGYNFQALEFLSVTSNRDNATAQYELGLGFGFSGIRPRIGPIAVPRLRVGYRFGDLEGIRIRIGGDWLTTVPNL